MTVFESTGCGLKTGGPHAFNTELSIHDRYNNKLFQKLGTVCDVLLYK